MAALKLSAGTPPVRISAALMVSRASCIARMIAAIHGEPGSSGREAMVPAAGRQDGCRLATALELRRSTNRAAEIRTVGVAQTFEAGIQVRDRQGRFEIPMRPAGDVIARRWVRFDPVQSPEYRPFGP
jgi:hypothetical protein